jgi:hypothetical protein
MSENHHSPNHDPDIREQLQRIEQRLARLESKFEALPAGTRQRYLDEDDEEEVELRLPKGSSSLIESRIGEYGFAWLGNIVLILGIIFLTDYILRLGKPMIAASTGYLLTGALLVTARFMRNSYTYMASLFTLFSQFLLYYMTLRLHYFTGNPLLQSAAPVLILLLLLTALQAFLAARRKSPLYATVVILMASFTALVSDSALLLPVITMMAAGMMVFFYVYGWHRSLYLAILMTYLVILVWLLNNPLMGHPLQTITQHHNSYFFLAVCAAVFSLVPLLPQRGKFPDSAILVSILLNGLGFSLLIAILVILFFPATYMWIFLSIALYCMAYATLLKKFSSWSYPPALFVLYGFVALSVSIFGWYGLPRSYFLLSLQSLLVLSFALWFRSKIIVVMNFFLFLMLLITYSVTSGHIQSINFSFPVVAFVSARIINWQKERLRIETELIRNTYLVVLFLTMLYACYMGFPGQFITLSWTVTAIVYFVMSIILKNVKYRYLALANVIATALYLFTVDLARIEVGYRIVAFLFLAVITIFISASYVRKLKKKGKAEEETGI